VSAVPAGLCYFSTCSRRSGQGIGGGRRIGPGPNRPSATCGPPGCRISHPVPGWVSRVALGQWPRVRLTGQIEDRVAAPCPNLLWRWPKVPVGGWAGGRDKRAIHRLPIASESSHARVWLEVPHESYGWTHPSNQVGPWCVCVGRDIARVSADTSKPATSGCEFGFVKKNKSSR